jgi:hypothetical protein
MLSDRRANLVQLHNNYCDNLQLFFLLVLHEDQKLLNITEGDMSSSFSLITLVNQFPGGSDQRLPCNMSVY